LIGTFERRFLSFEIAEASFGLNRPETLARLGEAADRLAQLAHLVVALLLDLEPMRDLKAMQRPECLEAVTIRLDRARVSPQCHVRLPRAVVRPRQEGIFGNGAGELLRRLLELLARHELHADAINLQRFAAILFGRELGAASSRFGVDQRSKSQGRHDYGCAADHRHPPDIRLRSAVRVELRRDRWRSPCGLPGLQKKGATSVAPRY
jgi:hypothetical protein